MTGTGAQSPRQALALRRFSPGDLAAALSLQATAYPAFLCEGPEAFASRLDLPGTCCLVAMRGPDLAGYLLAHAWSRGSPPAIGAILRAPATADVLYIHDLAVRPSERGTGAGRALVMQALSLAARDGLASAELIAVEGAADYWRTLGFAETPVTGKLAGKVGEYGPEARWMTRTIPAAGSDPDLAS